MSTQLSGSTAPRVAVELPGPGPSDAASAPARARGVGTVSTAVAGAGGAAAPPWLAAAGTSASSWTVSAAASRGSGAGYASGSGGWSFLSDASLSIEEKLARFMMTVQKNLDDELTTKMNDYRAKYGEGGSEARKEEGGGGFLGGILKAIFPSGGLFDSLFGGLEKMLGDALKSFGGPLLGALATAVGLPMLAPAAAKLGASIGAALSDGLQGKKTGGAGKGTTAEKGTPAGKGTSTGKTSSSGKSGTTAKPSSGTPGSTKKGEAGSPDERLEMLEIQRLVEKQNQLFTLVSNLMKGMHETTMVAVQNVR